MPTRNFNELRAQAELRRATEPPAKYTAFERLHQAQRDLLLAVGMSSAGQAFYRLLDRVEAALQRAR